LRKNIQISKPSNSPSKIVILEEKEKSLHAAILQQQKGVIYDPDIHSETVMNIVYQKEVARVLKELDETILEIKRSINEQNILLEKEQEFYKEQLQINSALQHKLEEKEKHIPTSNKEIFLKNKVQEYNNTNTSLVKDLSKFLGTHFPAIELELPKRKQNNKSNDDNEENIIYNLANMLQELMNLSVSKPHDPYVRLTKEHYAPYIELLLRAQIAEKHPTNSELIRLIPFHR